MKKRILALLLSMLLSVSGFSVWAEAEENNITAVDGNITVSCKIEAEAGTPVMIFILPQVLENGEDVTLLKIKGLTSSEILKTVNVEYVGVEKVTAEGKITHSCKMKSSLTTGTCHIILSYIGSNGCLLAGSFEHVGEDDKKALLSAMNKATAADCEEIINADLNGTNENPIAKEILRKSSADVNYYSGLSESEKAAFHNLLYKFKGNADFDLFSLVAAFNASGVWHRLSAEEDTLSVLKNYNGESEDKYWNVEIGDDSDFITLSDEEKAGMLEKIKEAKHFEKASLEKDFHDYVVLALFRALSDRDELDELISESGKYADDFKTVREIVEEAELSAYKTALLYNDVLDGAASCKTMEDVEDLFKESIPEESSSSGGGGSGGGGGKKLSSSTGYKSAALPNGDVKAEETKKSGFDDVSENHWAAEYIEKLAKDGVINGVDSDCFVPETSIKRQDFVKILVGALKMSLSDKAPEFSDVESGAYYKAYIMTAVENGLISGTGDGVFGVGADITREDAALIMSRVLDMYETLSLSGEINFNDFESISEYAKEGVLKAARAKIFSGDENGNFNPKEKLTRAETCAIICRLAEKIKGE